MWLLRLVLRLTTEVDLEILTEGKCLGEGAGDRQNGEIC